MKNEKCKIRKGFSLIELIIVIIIIGILSGAAYIGIQKAKVRTMNDKVLDDLIAVSNALEQYKRDHFDSYPVPASGGNMNLNCFYADATYAHDCANAAFMQGMIDNDLLTKRYLSEVPTDPRTGSRYVYGVSMNGKYFEVAGIVQDGDGSWNAKTVNNLGKGYHLPSLIRAYDGPNFVVNDGDNLPYSPDHLVLSAELQNINGAVYVCPQDSDENCGTEGQSANTYGQPLISGDIVATQPGASVDLYFSDGSVTHLAGDTQLKIQTGTEVAENDSDNLITKIRLKLLSGKIWNKVARLASSSEFNVEASGAIAGVRGTEFGVDANADILVYSGEICLDSIEICATSITGTPEIPGGATGNTGLTDLMMEQTSSIYLNNNISPRILNITDGTVTIANINTYYQVEEGKSFMVDSVKAYQYSADEDPVLTTFNCPATEPQLDYECDAHYLVGQTVVFRFEYGEDYQSGFSVPVTISASGTMTEEEIYSEEGEEEGEGMALTGGCQIILDYPIGDFYSTPANLQWHTEGCEALQFSVVLDGGAPILLGETTSYDLAGLTGVDHEWFVSANADAYTSNTVAFSINEIADTCTPGEELTETCTEGVGQGVKTITCTAEKIWSGNLIDAECVLTSCLAGNQLIGGSCTPCTIAHPTENYQWITSCEWGCLSGYEKIVDVTSAICKPTIENIQITGPTSLTLNIFSDSFSATATKAGIENVAVSNMCTWSSSVVAGEWNTTSYTFKPSVVGETTIKCQIDDKLGETGYIPISSGAECTYPSSEDDTTACTTVANGTNKKTRNCNTDDTWGAWSSCQLTCNSGYTQSGTLLCEPTLLVQCVGTSTALGRETIIAGSSYKNTTKGTYYSTSLGCWALGDSGASCDSACPAKVSGTTCVAGDWNDAGSNICKTITGSAISPVADDIGHAPYFYTTYSKCYYRGVYDYISPATLCNTLSPSGKQRICKCQ